MWLTIVITISESTKT